MHPETAPPGRGERGCMKVGRIEAVSVSEMILEVLVGSEMAEVVVCEEKGMEV